MLKIGVVGFSKEFFEVEEANFFLKKLITEIISIHSPKQIEIVSGLTNQGIPKLSYLYAQQMKYTTIGIAPKQAKTVKKGVFKVDKEIIFGQKFGDESQTFIDYIDVLVRVGGGKQSRHEVELFKEKILKDSNKKLEKYLLESEIKYYGK
jgi:hypothetical protein